MALFPVAATASITLLIQVLAYLIDPRLRFFSDSGVYLISANSFLDPAAPLPIYRERSNLFSIIWTPLLHTSHSAMGVIAGNGVVVALAAAVLCWALLGRGFTSVWATATAVLTACLPSVIYFQHVALSESSAYAATMVWVSAVLWADAKPRVPGYALVGLLTGLLAMSVRTSFTLLLTAFLGALVLRMFVRAVRKNPSFIQALGRGLLVLITTVLAAGLGLVTGSALQGALSHAPATQQLMSFQQMSGFNLIFKFGELDRCVPPSDSAEENAVCTILSRSRQNAYDQIMWTQPVLAAWSVTPLERVPDVSDRYGELAQRLVMQNPQGALGLMARDAWRMLNPLEHPRFTESTNQDIVASPAFPEAAFADKLYLVSMAQDALRIILLAVIAISIVVLGTRRFAGTAGLLLLTWLACFALLTATAFPTVRLLVPFDPLLLIGFALAIHGSRRPPARPST